MPITVKDQIAIQQFKEAEVAYVSGEWSGSWLKPSLSYRLSQGLLQRQVTHSQLQDSLNLRSVILSVFQSFSSHQTVAVSQSHQREERKSKQSLQLAEFTSQASHQLTTTRGSTHPLASAYIKHEFELLKALVQCNAALDGQKGEGNTMILSFRDATCLFDQAKRSMAAWTAAWNTIHPALPLLSTMIYRHYWSLMNQLYAKMSLFFYPWLCEVKIDSPIVEDVDAIIREIEGLVFPDSSTTPSSLPLNEGGSAFPRLHTRIQPPSIIYHRKSVSSSWQSFIFGPSKHNHHQSPLLLSSGESVFEALSALQDASIQGCELLMLVFQAKSITTTLSEGAEAHTYSHRPYSYEWGYECPGSTRSLAKSGLELYPIIHSRFYSGLIAQSPAPADMISRYLPSFVSLLSSESTISSLPEAKFAVFYDAVLGRGLFYTRMSPNHPSMLFCAVLDQPKGSQLEECAQHLSQKLHEFWDLWTSVSFAFSG